MENKLSRKSLELISDPNLQVNIKEIIQKFDGNATDDEVNRFVEKCLKHLDFKILKSDGYEIISIMKKSTNEIFTKGDTVRCTKYNKNIENIYFTDTLTGCLIRGTYYINYVTNGGLYRLDEIESIK